MKTHKTANVPGGITETVKQEIKNDIGAIDWKREYGNTPTDGEKRAFIWGMALHSLADAFAHSVYVDGKVITHSAGADKTDYHKHRGNHAQKAGESAMEKDKKDNTCGTYGDFDIAKSATDYKMINIKDYMTDVMDSRIASGYSSVNVNIGLSTGK